MNSNGALVHGMSNANYHALPDLGASGIKALAKSPAHFYGAYLDPNRPGPTETPSQANGTLTHCAVLEPSELAARYVAKPDGHDGRTAAGKAWAAENAGRIIVGQAQLASAFRQRESVMARADLARLFSSGFAEISAFWEDKRTGIKCKCRPDWVAPDGNGGVILVDLKTAVDASPRGFQKAISNYDYHVQAAWYSHGYEQASGLQVTGFVFAVVENTWPHVAAAYMLDDEALHVGAGVCEAMLDLYAECLANNNWPGYPDTLQRLNLPAWMLETTELEIEYA